MDEPCLQRDDHAGFRRLLADASEGNPDALARMLPLVYHELHRMASRYLRRERRDHTLQPTALVHEAYLRLVGQDPPGWKNHAHFRAIAAQTMRRILVEHARRRGRQKRGGAILHVELDPDVTPVRAPRIELESIDQALSRLEALDPQQARLVELRFFAGLSVEETAEVLSVSKTTVKREWAMARAWLRRELERD
jgi:RNA polymerase sigma factor (TIGR02999 family)